MNFIPLLILLVFSSGRPIPVANSLDQQDFSYLYDPSSELEIDHKLMRQGNDAFLFLFLKMRKDVYEIGDYDVMEEYVNSFRDKFSSLDTLKLLTHIIKRNRNGFYFKLPLRTDKTSKFYVLHFANKHNQKQYYYYVALNENEKIGNSNFYFTDESGLPVFHNWIPGKIAGNLNSTRKDSLLYIYYYSTEFDPAQAPMVKESALSSRMGIDSIFVIPASQTGSLNMQGLYLIQYDTTSLKGIAFRLEDDYYPKLVKIDDVINSLRYMSTRAEWETLNTTSDKKAALDAYWLAISKTPDMAKSLIKRYFDNVEEANRLFTTYKEGWKTDMGMLYIILGPPDEVRRDEKSEEWVYNKTNESSKLRFTFERVPNIFSSDHYVLQRKSDYENDWFKGVDFWRKGKFIISNK